jgi:hypothetical protein
MTNFRNKLIFIIFDRILTILSRVVSSVIIKALNCKHYNNVRPLLKTQFSNIKKQKHFL